ncbi:GNAT family N-acetyltransferase [Ferrimonas gelatinilytica]|uniref:GNAT family N-acetyltransferase n=1 Tax=Ferrimonas gelatinilytica TaxID=1255257 RepID=A0ABP9RUZ4_9GAMM
MATLIPILHTDRLCLRPWRAEDLDAYAAFCADPEVMRYLGGDPLSRNDAWRHLAMMVGHWQLKGFGHWAVEHSDSATVIGRIGLWQPEGWPGVEIGWTLARPVWGQGFAREGAAAALEWGFRQRPFDRVISLIHKENLRSRSVALALGLHYCRPTRVCGHPVDLFQIERETFMQDDRENHSANTCTL